MKRSLPPGAKPKERPFAPAPPQFLPSDSPQDASRSSSSFNPAKTESYNPLYQLHHKGAGLTQTPSGQFNAMNSSISHVNHGFFDSSFPFDPSMDIHQGSKNAAGGQTSIAPPAQFQTQLERPPSLLPKGSSTGQPFDHSPKDLEQFNNGNPDKDFGSVLFPPGKQSRESDLEGSLYSEDGQFDGINPRHSDELEGLEGSGDRLVSKTKTEN